MEIEYQYQSQAIFKGIVQCCDPQVQLSFLQFLQTEIILNIALIAKKYKKQEYFYKLALVLVYFKSYLNRVDRSMYYLFYEEKEFTTLENTFIINIAKKAENTFFQLRNSYQTLITKFQDQSQCTSDQEELRNILQCIFFQTDYPLPACKRQTIGVYCETPYQQFISLIRFPLIQTPQDYIEPPLQEMRKYFLQQCDLKKTVQYIQQTQKTTENISKISLVRYCSHELKNIEIQSLYIQGFYLHNLIVVLFKLIGINAKASKLIIKEHQDPIMKIAQFVTRANIFKNIVLAVEQKFGFLFQSYGDIYYVITKGQHCVSLPKFQFWNGAMAIWVKQFQEIQQQLFNSFNYIVLRQREINTMNFLAQKCGEFPSVYNPIKLQLEKKSWFQVKKGQAYKKEGMSYQNFFQQNIDSYDVLGKDFLQHQVDISINQFNVHKCGHSQHVIKRIPFFKGFVESFKQSSNTFYAHLQKLVWKKNNDKKLRLSILKDLIKFDLEFLECRFVKPVILKEVLMAAQEFIQFFAKKLPQFAVFTEEACEKYGLHFDFSQKDNILDYFCAKSETPNDCNAKLRCFYDTYKDKNLQEMLHLALSSKKDEEAIQSQIEEEFYESSQSNNSFVSLQEE